MGSTRPLQPEHLMKLWVSTRLLSYSPNTHRPPPINTLHCPHRSSLLFRYTHHPERPQRVTTPLLTRQRRLPLFRLYVHPHCPRHLLQLILITPRLTLWNPPFRTNDSHRLHGLRTALRPNKLLSSHCNYKLCFRNPIHWNHTCPMGLRGIRSKQRNPRSFLHTTLPTTILTDSPKSSSFNISPRNRLK